MAVHILVATKINQRSDTDGALHRCPHTT